MINGTRFGKTIYFPIVDQENSKLGIVKLSEMHEKLKEERLEVDKEHERDIIIPEKLVDEIYDEIQVCINQLERIDRIFPGIAIEGATKHYKKLEDRGMKFKKILTIE